MNTYAYDESGKVFQVFFNGHTAPRNSGIRLIDSPLLYSYDACFVKEGTLYPKPTSPSYKHVFDYSLGVWIDPRSLEDYKDEKNSEINAARAKANATSFTYLGKEIACDHLSRSDIDAVNGEVSLTGSLPASWPGAWKAKDNSYVPIPDVAAWTAFYQAMTAQGTANFVYSQTLKARVALASTIVEVEAVNW